MLKKILAKSLRLLRPPKPFRYPEHLGEATLKTWRAIKEQGLTYLTDERLASLTTLLHDLEQKQIEGDILEAGCARGGSAILLCRVKQPGRKQLVYDVFEMIPPPGTEDGEDAHERYKVISSGRSEGIDGKQYYGYETDLKQQVENSFSEEGLDIASHNVSLVEGLVQDTIEGDSPVALAHIDLDWYDPVMTCLERIMPRLVVGGSLVLDDYQDWSGCRKAVDEFFAQRGKSGLRFDTTPGHLVITRLADG